MASPTMALHHGVLTIPEALLKSHPASKGSVQSAGTQQGSKLS